MWGRKAREGRGTFLKKRTKKLLSVCLRGRAGVQMDEVFLLLFLQKKKVLACFLDGGRARA